MTSGRKVVILSAVCIAVLIAAGCESSSSSGSDYSGSDYSSPDYADTGGGSGTWTGPDLDLSGGGPIQPVPGPNLDYSPPLPDVDYIPQPDVGLYDTPSCNADITYC